MRDKHKLYISGRPYYGNNTGISRFATIYIKALNDWCLKNNFELIGVFQLPPERNVPLPMRVILAHKFFKIFPPTFFERFIAPVYYKLGNADLIMNFSGLGAPWWTRNKTISVFYDAIVEIAPETMARGTRALFKIFWKKDFLRTKYRVVITDSLISRVLKYEKDQACKNVVLRCPFGMDYSSTIATFKEERKKHIESKLEHKKYFLAVGSIEPRKRYKELVESFLLFREQTGSNIKLKICGGETWGIADKSFLISEFIEVIENVNDKGLIKLYANCTAVISAELYGGYGMPLYEARMFGIPILINNVPEFREAAGLNAVIADFSDPEDVVKKFIILSKMQFTKPSEDDINLFEGVETLNIFLNSIVNING